MGYNWEQIFKEKAEQELVKIYSGESHLDFEASIYAGLELKNRKFDFQRIEEIHSRKLVQLKMEIKDFEDQEFIASKYFRSQVLNIIGFSGLIYFLIKHKDEIIGDDYIYIRTVIYAIIALIAVLTAKWNFNRFKRNKRKSIEKKISLLRMMTIPEKE